MSAHDERLVVDLGNDEQSALNESIDIVDNLALQSAGYAVDFAAEGHNPVVRLVRDDEKSKVLLACAHMLAVAFIHGCGMLADAIRELPERKADVQAKRGRGG